MVCLKFLILGTVLACAVNSFKILEKNKNQQTSQVGPISEIFHGLKSKLYRIWSSSLDNKHGQIKTDNIPVNFRKTSRNKRSNPAEEFMNRMSEMTGMGDMGAGDMGAGDMGGDMGGMGESFNPSDESSMTLQEKLAIVNALRFNVSVPVTTPRPAFRKWTKRPVRAAVTPVQVTQAPVQNQPPPQPQPKQQPPPPVRQDQQQSNFAPQEQPPSHSPSLNSAQPPMQHQDLTEPAPQSPQTQNTGDQPAMHTNQGPPSDAGPVEDPMNRNPFIAPSPIEAQPGPVPPTDQDLPVAPTEAAEAAEEHLAEAQSEGYVQTGNQQPYIPDVSQRRFLPNRNRQLMNAPQENEPSVAAPTDIAAPPPVMPNPFAVPNNTHSAPLTYPQQNQYQTNQNLPPAPPNPDLFPADPRQPPPHNLDPGQVPYSSDPYPVDPNHPPPPPPPNPDVHNLPQQPQPMLKQQPPLPEYSKNTGQAPYQPTNQQTGPYIPVYIPYPRAQYQPNQPPTGQYPPNQVPQYQAPQYQNPAPYPQYPPNPAQQPNQAPQPNQAQQYPQNPPNQAQQYPQKPAPNPQYPANQAPQYPANQPPSTNPQYQQRPGQVAAPQPPSANIQYPAQQPPAPNQQPTGQVAAPQPPSANIQYPKAPNGQYPPNHQMLNHKYVPNPYPGQTQNPRSQYALGTHQGGDDVLHHLPVGRHPTNTGAAPTPQTYPGHVSHQPAYQHNPQGWQQGVNNPYTPGQPIPTNPSPTGSYPTTNTGHEFTDKYPHPSSHSVGSMQRLNPGYPPDYVYSYTTVPPPAAATTRPMTEAEREAIEEAAEDRMEALARLNAQGHNLTELPPNYTIPPEAEEIEYEDGLLPPTTTPTPTQSPYWFEGPPYNGMHYYAHGSPGIYPDKTHGQDVGIYPLTKTTPPVITHPYHLLTGHPTNQNQPYNYPNQPANQHPYYKQPLPSQPPMKNNPYYPQQYPPTRHQNQQHRQQLRQPIILNQQTNTRTNQNPQYARPPAQQTNQNRLARPTNQINRNYQPTNQRQPIQQRTQQQQAPPRTQQAPPRTQQAPPQTQQAPPRQQVPPQQAPPRTQQAPPRTQQVPPTNQQPVPRTQPENPPQETVPSASQNAVQTGQAAFLNQDTMTTTTDASVSNAPVVVAAAVTGPTSNEVAGIVVGSILGILVIVIPLLCLGVKYKRYLKMKRKRFFPRPFSQRNEQRGSRDAMDTMVFSELGQERLPFDSDGHQSPSEHDHLMTRPQAPNPPSHVSTISGTNETNLYNNNTENNQSETPRQPMSLTSSKRSDSLEISRLLTLREGKEEEIYSDPPEEPPARAPVLPPRGKNRGKGFPKHFNGSVQMLHK